jgi:hypothetical protein
MSDLLSVVERGAESTSCSPRTTSPGTRSVTGREAANTPPAAGGAL